MPQTPFTEKIDGVDVIRAEHVNLLQTAVNNLERALDANLYAGSGRSLTLAGVEANPEIRLVMEDQEVRLEGGLNLLLQSGSGEIILEGSAFSFRALGEPLFRVTGEGQVLNLTSWGLQARMQGLMILPESDRYADDGNGNLEYPPLIIMNPAAGSYLRVNQGTASLGTWGYLYVDLPPAVAPGSRVEAQIGAWIDGTRDYDHPDRLVLAQRIADGRIIIRWAPLNRSGFLLPDLVAEDSLRDGAVTRSKLAVEVVEGQAGNQLLGGSVQVVGTGGVTTRASVNFSQPFSAPPAVVLTADNSRFLLSAITVTTGYFILEARQLSETPWTNPIQVHWQALGPKGA